ncbi:MAG: helix-turn-helix transcriptional regulator [Oscillospiraceae bacterium]
MYLTPNYLGNVFLTETGVSFKTYLINYRMKKAKELLLTGNYNVNEVSEAVGYKNLDHFRKSFKQCIGTNPSDFITK